tara:strand:- start:1262 stop:1699 length:438 start_codon:yes stop_codon:yes gene_type:complete
MQTKRNSRKFAVQAVFQFFFSNENIDKILEEFLSFRSQETENQVIKYDTIFLKKIVNGVFENKEKIKNIIEQNLSKEWLIERVDPTMHAILSLAIYEFFSCKNTPLKVILNEYVSIASLYLDDINTGFVNGILDKIGKNIRNKVA